MSAEITEPLSTLDLDKNTSESANPHVHHLLALMIAWSAEEPWRVGEVAVFEMEGSACILGRGNVAGGARAVFERRRPGSVARCPPLQNPGVSREQLRIIPRQGKLDIECIGRCPMLFHGVPAERVSIAPGDVLVLRKQLVLLCTLRPDGPPSLRHFPMDRLGAFGEPDGLGLLGESPVMWMLRDALAFDAKAGAHVLVRGPSGVGKELCAHALHELSPRSGKPFVARNAATLPSGLVDAELFGNAKNYPNPGMAERPGLVGAADGGTLFFDEIAELPIASQANLLRLLDEGGEYHRLGEAAVRHADLRLIGATNRPPEALKHDLLARLPLRLEVPGLEQRRDDIPLLMKHLLRRALSRSPELLGRFAGPKGEVRVSGELTEYLLRHSYTTHIRELDELLWKAIAESEGERVDLPKSPREEAPAALNRVPLEPERLEAAYPSSDSTIPPSSEKSVTGDEGGNLEREELLVLLAEHKYNLVKAAAALGLPSRYALYRRLRRHGIEVRALRSQKK